MSETSHGATAGADPYSVLGVSAEATADEIRAAYLDKVKTYPPDRSPVEFERVRDAYESLRDPRQRAQLLMTAVDPLGRLETLLEGAAPIRCHVGPKAWLRLMEEV